MNFFSLLDQTVKMEYLETFCSSVFLRHWSYLLLTVVEKSIQQPFIREHHNVMSAQADGRMDDFTGSLYF